MKEYGVVITEMLRKVVYVEAASAEQAEKQAYSNWKDGEYIMDAENFIGVDISEEGRAKAHRTGNKRKGHPGHER